MGCGCGGKSFSGSARQSSGTTVVSAASQAAASGQRTIVAAQGVKFGKAPVIQPMQRKTV